MPRKKERTPELREQLLAVAIELLADGGVAACTTRAIATRAGASAPAIYELFDDKAGLVRAVFFEGFRRLGVALDALPPAEGDARDLLAAIEAFRRFSRRNVQLFRVMYSRPFSDFTPSPSEQALGDTTRRCLVERAEACVESGSLAGDPVDIAHGVLALCIGLATQETGGWLGSSAATRDRRWRTAADALLSGYVA